MKTTITKLWNALPAAALLLSLNACSNDALDQVNEDESRLKLAPSKFVLTDVLTATAVSNAGGDLNTYASVYTEQEAGVDNQLFAAETRIGQPISASTYNNNWVTLYATLRNCKVAADNAKGDALALAVSQVMEAYNLALLTDLFGDVPYSDGFDYKRTLTPKLDKQQDLYATINSLLDKAIAALEKEPDNTLGTNDLLYGGDVAKWTKFAYGLKARYTMRLLYRAADKNAACRRCWTMPTSRSLRRMKRLLLPFTMPITSTPLSTLSGAATVFRPVPVHSRNCMSATTRAWGAFM